MRTKFPVFLSTAACLAFGSLANAHESYCCPPPTPKKVCCCCCIKSRPKPLPYIELGVGQAFNSLLNSNTFSNSDPDNPENLTVSQKNSASPLNALLGMGWVWRELYPKNTDYLPYLSLGLQYQYTNLTNKKTTVGVFDNQIDPDGPGIQDSYTVPYAFSQMSLLATAKLDLYKWRNVMPYLSAGIGASRNRAKQKGPIYSTDFGNIYNYSISTERNTSFSYTVGAGLDFPINETFWLSLGYNYNNFGSLKFGHFEGEQPPSRDLFRTVKLGNFSTHNIQLTGRYLFA